MALGSDSVLLVRILYLLLFSFGTLPFTETVAGTGASVLTSTLSGSESCATASISSSEFTEFVDPAAFFLAFFSRS
ncbi:hypothetical protein ERO13_A04G030604v2 [Gossypium hirsutum]|nr:hypothetical protein ERO13_A04G030604v2 [Gossypium hirsutum]